MRILKMILWTAAVILGTALLAVAISTLSERNAGETVLSFWVLRVTVTGVGGALGVLTILLFAALRMADLHKRNEKASGIGEWLNAIGFGLLPGAAVWLVFETATTLGKGKEVFDPLPRLPLVTEEGRFAPSWIELFCAVLCFAAILAWLMARKRDLPGNGDLLMTVLCIWSMLRTVTETFRAEPFIAVGSASVTQILFLTAADLCLIIWTVRKERTQKSTAFAVLEWIAVLACQTVIVLTSAGVLTAGSMIGDFAVIAGCALLCLLLMLLSGKDSRAGKIIIAGSGNPAYDS